MMGVGLGLDFGWVKSMPGDFGEFTVNIGLGINFLAGGTLFFNSNDTLSYGSIAWTIYGNYEVTPGYKEQFI